MADEQQQQDIRMDPQGLYREEVFTDRRVGTIHKMTPVKQNGEADDSRSVVWVGQAQMMTPAGALPLHFEIDAKDLAEASEKFGDGAQQAAEETMERLKEMRREQASSIMTPETGGYGGMGGQGGQGGPGGGIQMP
jgi:hypothetical protein